MVKKMETEYQMDPIGEGGQNEDEMDYGQMPEGYNDDGQEVDEDADEYAQFAFPSFSPTSRKRVRLRKPNFSDECIDLLIELVNEHRDILYTKKAYTNDVHEKKIMVWTHITSKINAISSIPRTMEEVRKKWNDYSYYVKKKRENEKRGIHYTPDTRNEQYEAEEQEVEGGRKVLKRDSKKIRRREDRVLQIVDTASREGGMVDHGEPFGHMESRSLLPSKTNDNETRDPSYDPTFDEDDDESEEEVIPAPTSRNIPRSTNVPPLPNPISNYGYSSRGSYSRGRGIRRSARVKNPSHGPYASTHNPRGRGRGRGRPPLSGAQHGTKHGNPVDEDLVLVNKQLLAMERKMLNVEKKRLQIELRKLEIEEERFKWEMAERGKIYSEVEQEQEEENQEEVTEASENQNTSQDTENETEQQQETIANNEENTIANNEQEQPEQQTEQQGELSEQQPQAEQEQQQQQQQNGLSLQDVCSPVKFETHSPEPIPQPHSPIVITTETPSLTPVDETF